jgi:hypothetical protein
MLLSSNRHRLKHLIAMACIGDGVMAIVRPQEDLDTWDAGPAPWLNLIHALRRRPTLTRLLGAAEVLAAIRWVVRHDKAS